MKLKRILAAGLSVASLVTIAACGSTSGSDDNTITFWTNATAGDGLQYWKDYAAAFEKAHDGVKVEVQAIQNEDYEGKLATAMQDPSSGPDVFMNLGGKKDEDMIDAGQMMDLTDKITSANKDKLGSSLDAATFGGKIYSLPMTVQPGGIWYSKDLFAKAGIDKVPTTWTEFMDACAKLKAAGIDPIAVGAKDAWPAAHWFYWSALRMCSADAYDKSLAKMDFSNSCWTAAGEKLKALNDAGYFNEGYLTTTAQQGASSSAGLLANHKAAMELMGTWEPGVLKDLTPDKKPMADLGFFAFPAMDDGKGDPNTLMGSITGYAVNPKAPNIAIDFINGLASKEWQDKYAKAFETIPATEEAQNEVKDANLSMIIQSLKSAKGMKIWMDTSLGSNIGGALNSAVVNLLSGNGSPQDITKAMKDAAARADTWC